MIAHGPETVKSKVFDQLLRNVSACSFQPAESRIEDLD